MQGRTGGKVNPASQGIIQSTKSTVPFAKRKGTRESEAKSQGMPGVAEGFHRQPISHRLGRHTIKCGGLTNPKCYFFLGFPASERFWRHVPSLFLALG